MPITLDKMMQRFSLEEREDIKREAGRLVAENRTLGELRRALGLTQAQVADALETSQANVAQIESKTDVKVSTVTRIVEALGGTVYMMAVLPGQDPVRLTFGEDGITRRVVQSSVPTVPHVRRGNVSAVAAGPVRQPDATPPTRHAPRRSDVDQLAVAARRSGSGTTARAAQTAAKSKQTPPGDKPPKRDA
jgi:DNA-binding XRE family transcriptional regulator